MKTLSCIFIWMFLVVLGINGQSTNKYRYQIGEPTAEEQMYLELINRARTNPIMEAARLANITDPRIRAMYGGHGVDLVLMQEQFRIYNPVPPLFFNSNLIWAARQHTADQYTNNFQGHLGSDGTGPVERAIRAGYGVIAHGENAFAKSESVEFGHAGFEVDWGYSVGGMQTPPGHRHIIHSGAYREVGIGVTNFPANGYVGPQIVTQDFANRPWLQPFITGVVYYDFNKNLFYDVGEGLGGFLIESDNSDAYSISSKSGGYALPVSIGTNLVRFSYNGQHLLRRTVVVSNESNYKLDFRPQYIVPQLVGPSSSFTNSINVFLFSAISGAVSYQASVSERVKTNLVEGFESGTNFWRFALTGSYLPIQNGIKKTGASALRFAHPIPVDQIALMDKRFKIQTNSILTFCSRLSWGTPNQMGCVQISTNDTSWIKLWSYRGTSSANPAWFKYSIPLGDYAGKEAKIRLVYDHTGGNYFNQTSAGIGWHVDDLSISNVIAFEDETMLDLGTNTFFSGAFNKLGDFSLRVKGYSQDNPFPWGKEKIVVTVLTNSPNLALLYQNSGVLVSFPTVTGCSYILQKSVDLDEWNDLQIFAGSNQIVGYFDTENKSIGFYRVIVR